MSGPKQSTATEIKIDPAQKAMLLQAVSQLELFEVAFNNAPARVQAANKEFIASLKEWANG